MTPRYASFACAVICLMLAAGAYAAEPKPGGEKLDLSTKKDVLRSIDLGLRWLEEQQNEDGHWSLAQYPAITALVVRAHLDRPGRQPGDISPYVRKGLDFIAGCARKDGGIYEDVPAGRGGSLRHYNTSACMMALAASGRTEYDAVIERARNFLIDAQNLTPGPHYGGWGYDAEFGREYADMNNTGFVVESLFYTTFISRVSCAPPTMGLQQDRTKPDDPDAPKAADWQAAVAFLSRCQNLDAGKAEMETAVSPRPQDRGGFFYRPADGKAGGGKTDEGQPYWHSYGNATYVGLMCLLQANLDRDDRRMKAAVDWVRRNYTLEEHPGQGKQGLYFYYHTMAKALFLNAQEKLRLADGRTVDWRQDLAIKLLSLQRIDPKTGLGYWKNDVGRWMENDPVLTTAYCVLALNTLLTEAPVR